MKADRDTNLQIIPSSLMRPGSETASVSNRKKAVLALFTCLFLAAFIFAIAGNNGKPAIINNPQSVTYQSKLAKPTPFDLKAQNVGLLFRGDDIADVISRLKAAERKDEFETTDQYRARLDAFRLKPLVEATTPDGYFVFVQQDLYDGNIEAYEGSSVHANYDADKRLLNVAPDLGSGFGGGPIISKDGQGLDLRDRFSDPKLIRIPMTPEQAKSSKNTLNLMFICKLARP